MICTPRQRAAYRSSKCGIDLPIPDNPITDHCAHCLNAGGTGTVRKHVPPSGWQVYDPIHNFNTTASRAGFCGDPLETTAHMIGGDFMPYSHVPIVQTWKSGSVVDFHAELDTNHNGFFEFFLCNLDACNATDITGRCFQQGHCQKLHRVKHHDCENAAVNTSYECGPVDQDHPGRWYVPCRLTGHVGVHLVGGSSGTMRYQLPGGMTCKHCVLQWYWATANSCAPKGFLKYFEKYNNPFGTTCPGDGGAVGGYRAGMDECGGRSVPEEFWSCADVQITKDGHTAGAVKAVAEAIVKVPNAFTENDVLKEVKENTTEVTMKVQDKVKKDIESTVSQSPGEVSKEKLAGESGECILSDRPCDGSRPCCHVEQVCVFGIAVDAFTCRFWWSLWEEVELRV